jgi:type IV pilus assembly protein PilV
MKARGLTRRHLRKVRALAYTSVEVLIAITIFSIGAAGVIAMQRASIQGNYDARSMDVANNIAREWQERLQRDADLWRDSSLPFSTATTNTRWLKAATATPTLAVPTYPSGAAAGLSPAFDLLGRDLGKTDGEGSAGEVATFCTQISLAALPNPKAGEAERVIRAVIRVAWTRNGATLKCLEGAAFDPTTPADKYRTLTTVALVRGNFK